MNQRLSRDSSGKKRQSNSPKKGIFTSYYDDSGNIEKSQVQHHIQIHPSVNPPMDASNSIKKHPEDQYNFKSPNQNYNNYGKKNDANLLVKQKNKTKMTDLLDKYQYPLSSIANQFAQQSLKMPMNTSTPPIQSRNTSPNHSPQQNIYVRQKPLISNQYNIQSRSNSSHHSPHQIYFHQRPATTNHYPAPSHVVHKSPIKLDGNIHHVVDGNVKRTYIPTPIYNNIPSYSPEKVHNHQQDKLSQQGYDIIMNHYSKIFAKYEQQKQKNRQLQLKLALEDKNKRSPSKSTNKRINISNLKMFLREKYGVAIDDITRIRKNNILSRTLKLMDETMASIDEITITKEVHTHR